jgi:hypothetical protein
MDLYSRSKPSLRVRWIRFLINYTMRLVKKEKDIGVHLEFGTANQDREMPLDACTLTIHGFEIMNFRSADFMAIDDLINEVSKDAAPTTKIPLNPAKPGTTSPDEPAPKS